MESRTIRRVVVAVVFPLTLCVARAAETQQTGAYALPQGKAKIVSHLSLVNGPRGAQTLVLMQYALRSSVPLTRYALTEDEPLHVVIVRDDFKSFAHLHPQPSGSGVFRLPVSLQSGHRYYTYVASQPAGMPEQVFRFVLKGGAGPSRPVNVAAAPSRGPENVGPYKISIASMKVPAMRALWFGVHITRNGRPYGAIPYHNADMKAMVVNVATLQYVDVDGFVTQGICCEYELRMPILLKGLYRMWLQFYDGKSVYTAPFTFAAQ